MAFTVILDANVLYPCLLRDLLIRLAQQGLFRAKWTNEIHLEWIEALLRDRGDLDRARLERTRELMNRAVPDCLVSGHMQLVEQFELPDEDDRHVLAAAVRVDADMIVTYNVKDFPAEYLEQYDIEAIHPDDFIYCQFDLSENRVAHAVIQQLESLRNPPFTADEFLTALEKRELTKTAARLRATGILQNQKIPVAIERKVIPFESKKLH